MKSRKTLFFILIFVILLVNALHNSYPDEFDNILGGYFINHGILPYSGFFSHHGPLAYFLASFLTFFSGQSFVRFRLLTPLVYLAIFFATYWVGIKKVNHQVSTIFLGYILLTSVAATYFWGHMFLADPLSGYFLIPAYSLLFLKVYFREDLEVNDLAIISVFSAATLLTSITYSYTIIILDLATFIYFFKGYLVKRADKKFLTNLTKFTAIFALPYLIFIFYLLITRSVQGFIFDTIIYNKNYYIYNYPRPDGSTVFNPFRYAVVIFNNFYNTFTALIYGARDFNLHYPSGTALALSNLAFWLMLSAKRHFFLVILSFLLLVSVTARGNPAVGATDYQSAVYIVISFFNAAILFFLISGELMAIKNYFAKTILTGAMIITTVYWFFLAIFLVSEFWHLVYGRYMGFVPLIYDRPSVAPMINDIVPPSDYCWVGPFHFEEILYLKCKLPSKYHWILAQFGKSPEIRNELIEEFTTHKPDIIVYDRGYMTFGNNYQFFIDFLNSNYIRLPDNPLTVHYRFQNNAPKDFDLYQDVNLEKSKAPMLIDLLVAKGYLLRR